MKFICEYCKKEVKFFHFPARKRIKCRNCGYKTGFVPEGKRKVLFDITTYLCSIILIALMVYAELCTGKILNILLPGLLICILFECIHSIIIYKK